ncbi:hypothetical protein LCGC14_2796340, partial [marine sediment metagenome]
IKEGHITLMDANEIRMATEYRRQELLTRIRSLANSAKETMEKIFEETLMETKDED